MYANLCKNMSNFKKTSKSGKKFPKLCEKRKSFLKTTRVYKFSHGNR